MNSTTQDNPAKIEITSIGGLTLMFSEPELERCWQLSQLPRQMRISGRFLFFSTVFQIVFLFCDILDGFSSEFAISFRIFLAILTAIACFLVSSSIVIPHQMVLFWIMVCYSVPTLAFYCLSRDEMTHFDSFFLVYGLCFFTLPKFTPLDFIHSLLGNLLLVVMYCYISAFSLSVSQWIVSVALILFPAFMFLYISYTSERSCRERWLLRQRLQKEKISVQLVPSRIQDDLNETVLESERFYRMIRSGDPSSPGMFAHSSLHLTDKRTLSGSNESPSSSSSSRLRQGDKKSQRKQIIVKGLFAWFLCAVVGIIFEVININDLIGLRLNLSTAIAIFMYSSGFTIFLVLITGQTRWLSVNALVGLIVLFVMSKLIPQDYKTLASHTLGYIVVLAVLTSLIIVVGGVVILWRQLLGFVRDILIRYPEIRADIITNSSEPDTPHESSRRSSRGLHRVRNNSFPGPSSSSSLNDTTVLELLMSRQLPLVSTSQLQQTSTGNESSRDVDDCVGVVNSPARPFNLDPTMLNMDSRLLKIVKARREGCCYFCLKKGIHTLIPACDCWSDCCEVNNYRVEATCTPFQSLASQRDQLKLQNEKLICGMELIVQEKEVCRQKMIESRQDLLKRDDVISSLEIKLLQQSTEFKRQRQVDEEEFVSLSNDHVQSIKQLRKLLRSQKHAAILVEQELKRQIKDLQQMISDLPNAVSDHVESAMPDIHHHHHHHSQHKIKFQEEKTSKPLDGDDDDMDLEWILEAPLEELSRLFEEKSTPTSRVLLSNFKFDLV